MSNIVTFYGGCIMKKKDKSIAVIVLEYCSNGSLFDLLEKYQKENKQFSEEELIEIMKQTTKQSQIIVGLIALHSQKPPITHRDIKIENILLNKGQYKLCDFGSCSTEIVDFKKIESKMYYKYEDVFEKNTTLMYRPPEMCDLYKQYTVCQKVDVWMLGCVRKLINLNLFIFLQVYTLCFFKHPFYEAQKLAIVDAIFQIPKDSKYSDKMHNLIRNMLTPNPEFRPGAVEINQICQNYQKIDKIELNNQALEIKKEQDEYDQILVNPLKPQKKQEKFEEKKKREKDEQNKFSNLAFNNNDNQKNNLVVQNNSWNQQTKQNQEVDLFAEFNNEQFNQIENDQKKEVDNTVEKPIEKENEKKEEPIEKEIKKNEQIEIEEIIFELIENLPIFIEQFEKPNNEKSEEVKEIEKESQIKKKSSGIEKQQAVRQIENQNEIEQIQKLAKSQEIIVEHFEIDNKNQLLYSQQIDNEQNFEIDEDMDPNDESQGKKISIYCFNKSATQKLKFQFTTKNKCLKPINEEKEQK